MLLLRDRMCERRSETWLVFALREEEEEPHSLHSLSRSCFSRVEVSADMRGRLCTHARTQAVQEDEEGLESARKVPGKKRSFNVRVKAEE